MLYDTMLFQKQQIKPWAVRDKRKQTLLHAAARGGNVRILEYVLGKIEAVSLPQALGSIDRFHRSALHWAVLKANLGAIKVLLDHGSNPRQEIRKGLQTKSTHLPYESPLTLARRRGLVEVERLLLGKEI